MYFGFPGKWSRKFFFTLITLERAVLWGTCFGCGVKPSQMSLANVDGRSVECATRWNRVSGAQTDCCKNTRRARRGFQDHSRLANSSGLDIREIHKV
ncbi:hypothetical protein K438DRAFT_1807334 [Mycena galopus ATCC 62051]|nr:hypothetical protein K438DRAFT_1807334 [Mycena galopus ATCC 62051]